MAWGFIRDIPISREEYDRIDKDMPDDPKGLILHVAIPVGGQMRIIDVWDSKDQYDRFEREALLPAMGRTGTAPSGGGPLNHDEFQVHKLRGRGAHS